MKPGRTAHRITLVASSVALVAVGIVVALLGLELCARLIARHYLNPFEPDATLAFRLKANFVGRYPWTPVRTDEDGFRTPAVHAPSSRRAILFVGDSVTFGFSVLAEEAYPYRFGERIGRPGDVVNAAVPGYNLEQVIGTIRRVIASDRKPELIVYGLCLNDIDGARETARYEDIDPHGNRARRGGPLSSSLLVTVLERRVQRLWARIVPAPTVLRQGEPAPRPLVAAGSGRARQIRPSVVGTREPAARDCHPHRGGRAAVSPAGRAASGLAGTARVPPRQVRDEPASLPRRVGDVSRAS